MPSRATRAGTTCATGGWRTTSASARGVALLPWAGRRFSYVRDADAYIVGVLGDQKIVDEYEPVNSLERSSEYLMLGMRTVRGVNAAEYTRICLADFAPIEGTLQIFAQKGWAVQEEDGSWHFTPQGFLLSNILIGALLESQSSGRVEVTPWMKAAFDAEEKTELPPGEEELFAEEYQKTAAREKITEG